MSIPNFTAFSGTRPNRDTQTGQPLAENLDNALDFLITFNGEVIDRLAGFNQVATDANNAAASAATALAAANFKGNWSDQSGAAAIPYSVRGADEKYYMLILAMSDVTTHSPGVTSGWETYWAEIKVGGAATGRTATSTGTSATLDSGSLIYDVTTTADDLVISLPSASANFSEGALAAIVCNAGDKPFNLVSNGQAVYLANLFPGEKMFVYSKTVADADGTFFAYKQPINPELTELTLFESGNAQYINSCRIGTNKCLVTFADAGNSNHLTGVVLRLNSSGVLEAGLPVVIDNESVFNNGCCSTDVDDEAIVVCRDSAQGMNAHKLTVSGTVITVEDTRDNIATSVQGGSESYNVNVVMMSADTFVCGYNNGSGHPAAIAFTTTGHTINAPGSAVTGEAVNSRAAEVRRISDTAFTLLWNSGTSAFSLKAEYMTISGTTITTGSEEALSTGLAQVAEGVVLDNGILVAVATDAYSTSMEFTEVTTCTTSGSISEVGVKRFDTWPAGLSGFIQVAKLTRNSVVIVEGETNTKTFHVSVVLVADDGQMKIVFSDFVSPPSSNAETPDYTFLDITYMADGLVLLSARYPNDLSNYGYSSLISIPELVA